MLTEQFKPIKGYEGLYEVSNFGNLRSLDRVVLRTKNGDLPIKGRDLKPADDGRGYLDVVLTNGDSERHTHKVHHLVWDNFGDRERSGHKLQIDHRDDNAHNNHLSNLRLVTASENSIKRSSNLKKKSRYPNVSLVWNGTWAMEIMRDRRRYRKAGFLTETLAYLERQKLLLKLGEVSFEKS